MDGLESRLTTPRMAAFVLAQVRREADALGTEDLDGGGGRRSAESRRRWDDERCQEVVGYVANDPAMSQSLPEAAGDTALKGAVAAAAARVVVGAYQRACAQAWLYSDNANGVAYHALRKASHRDRLAHSNADLRMFAHDLCQECVGAVDTALRNRLAPGGKGPLEDMSSDEPDRPAAGGPMSDVAGTEGYSAAASSVATSQKAVVGQSASLHKRSAEKYANSTVVRRAAAVLAGIGQSPELLPLPEIDLPAPATAEAAYDSVEVRGTSRPGAFFSSKRRDRRLGLLTAHLVDMVGKAHPLSRQRQAVLVAAAMVAVSVHPDHLPAPPGGLRKDELLLGALQAVRPGWFWPTDEDTGGTRDRNAYEAARSDYLEELRQLLQQIVEGEETW